MSYDFYKEFMGVDIAKMEQISELIGMVEAKLYMSMVRAGLDETTAMLIIHDIHSVIVKEIMTMSAPK